MISKTVAGLHDVDVDFGCSIMSTSTSTVSADIGEAVSWTGRAGIGGAGRCGSDGDGGCADVSRVI